MAKMHVCPSCEARWTTGGLRVDPVRKCATWVGGEVHLTPTQSRIMAALARMAGQVVRRETLVDAGWGNDPGGGPDDVTHVVHTHICNIRRGLSGAGFPGRIKTIWGVGYELALSTS